uniref:Uncharacterized protein n=1 Tax=Anopheles coluzzii TaxID=1518534 RepID=A0A8W7PEJ6_ANOCL
MTSIETSGPLLLYTCNLTFATPLYGTGVGVTMLPVLLIMRLDRVEFLFARRMKTTISTVINLMINEIRGRRAKGYRVGGGTETDNADSDFSVLSLLCYIQRLQAKNS